MMGSISLWNQGLLFAAIMIVSGIVGIAAAPQGLARSLFQSTVLQGILMTCAIGAAFHEFNSHLRLVSLFVAGLLIYQVCSQSDPTDEFQTSERDNQP